jgi:5-methylcytosine-specific restriction endonuclease McrA
MPYKPIPARQKKIVIARANGCCEYCLSQFHYSMDPFSVEHIFPRSLGGHTELDNPAWACQGCNGHKHTRVTGIDPLSGQEVPLYHPRQHRWSEHFAWNNDCTQMVGLTDTGRATIATLHLNRQGVMNLRRVLYVLGEHPPELPKS